MVAPLRRPAAERARAVGRVLAMMALAANASGEDMGAIDASATADGPVTRQWCALTRLETLDDGWWKCPFSTANPENACTRGPPSSISPKDYSLMKDPVGTCPNGTTYAGSAIVEFRRLIDGEPVDPKPVPKIRQFCPEALLTETDREYRCTFTTPGAAKETGCWGGGPATILKSQFRINSRNVGRCPAMSRFAGSAIVEFLSISGDADPEPLPTVSYFCAKGAFEEVPELKKGVCTFNLIRRDACERGVRSSLPLDVYRRMARPVGVCPPGSLHAGDEILEFRSEGELPPEPEPDEARPSPPSSLELG
jgi:hypothetical protein